MTGAGSVAMPKPASICWLSDPQDTGGERGNAGLSHTSVSRPRGLLWVITMNISFARAESGRRKNMRDIDCGFTETLLTRQMRFRAL